MYSPQLLDHFEHPRNAGTLAHPHATARIENPACGDILEFTANFADGHIAQIRFRAKGCVASMACASALTELVQGKTLAEARRIGRDDLIRAVAGLPPASAHASHLAMDALESILKQFPGEV